MLMFVCIGKLTDATKFEHLVTGKLLLVFQELLFSLQYIRLRSCDVSAMKIQRKTDEPERVKKPERVQFSLETNTQSDAIELRMYIDRNKAGFFTKKTKKVSKSVKNTENRSIKLVLQ